MKRITNDLNTDEELVFNGIPDWTFILRYLFMVVLGAVAFAVIAVVFPRYWWAGAVALVLTLPTLAIAEVRRRHNHFVLTTERLRDIEGIIGRNAIDIPLDRIMNVSHKQSLLGRMVNSGTLYIESAGSNGKLEAEHTHEPSKLQALINKQVEVFNRQGPGHAVDPDSVDHAADEHYRKGRRSKQADGKRRQESRPPKASPAKNRRAAPAYVKQSLEDLSRLHDEQILSLEEYQQKRSELLKRF